MSTLLASHAQAIETAKTQGASAGTNRGHNALADLLTVNTSYTVTGAENVGDIIKLTGDLPHGLVFVPALSVAVVESNPGTLTVGLGVEGDSEVFADTVNIGTVGKRDLGTAPVDELPESQSILATIKSAASLAVGARITFYLVFRAVS